jgi:hypothetical protein
VRWTQAKSPLDDRIVRAFQFWICATVNASYDHNPLMRDLTA